MLETLDRRGDKRMYYLVLVLIDIMIMVIIIRIGGMIGVPSEFNKEKTPTFD